jgi:hypothetical protein
LKDAILTGILLVSFATLFTLHVWIAGRLVARPNRYRAALAFLVPPLAPVYAFREGWRRIASGWLVAVIIYAISLFLEQL